ncbi:hypothetical protein C8F01DRAFT_1181406, partial [Mycena amicta]
MGPGAAICTSWTISGPLHLHVALTSLRHLRTRKARLDPSRISTPSLTIRNLQRGHELPHTNGTEREEGAEYIGTWLGLSYGILRPRLFVHCALHLPLSCVLYGTSSFPGTPGASLPFAWPLNSLLMPSVSLLLAHISLSCTQDVFSLLPA